MDKIKELEQKITEARKNYYNGVSTISDQLYDAWIDELSKLDPKNLEVIGIGSEPISNWEKYIHKVPMGSLNKVQTDEEYKIWHNKYLNKDDNIFLTLKLDGLSVSLMYENGNLVRACTRGSGTIGELITPNVAKMIGVPLRLCEKINITVRGEILLSKENHLKFFSEYSNPRNAASGICRRYDGVGSDKLSVLVYDMVSDFDLKTQEELFLKLQSLSFNVPDFYVFKTYNEVLNKKNEYQSTLRDKCDYLLDGLVAHNNNLSKIAEAGSLNGRPYASIAIKFDSQCAETTLLNVEWEVGPTGRITPVAIIKPITISGVEVSKASLHNSSYFSSLKLFIGCRLLVSRRNDVIPYIEENLDA